MFQLVSIASHPDTGDLEKSLSLSFPMSYLYPSTK